jgi:uncharacterized membrane protein YwzB
LPPIIRGIRFLVGIITMGVMVISTIVFWKLYSLKNDKALKNKEKLKEIGL